MNVIEQRTGRFVVTMGPVERKRLYRLCNRPDYRPADAIFWQLWHWLKTDNTVTLETPNEEALKNNQKGV